MSQKFSPTRLREAREAAGFRREATAVAIDRSYQTIVSYELGRIQPPPRVLAAMAGLYGVPVGEFFVAEAVAV